MRLLSLIAPALISPNRRESACIRELDGRVEFVCNHFRLGNALMMYWNGRALAFFRHKDFRVTANRSDLVSHFPQSAEKTLKLTGMQAELWEKLQGLRDACLNCYFPHGNINAPWRLIGDKILAETQMVIKQVIGNASDRTKRYTNWNDRSTWAVFHFRCDKTLWTNEQYGFLRNSFIDKRLPNATTHMLIVGQVSGFEALCRSVLHEMVQWMTQTRGLSVAFQEASVEDDWLTLATAPILFCSSSTFCLTAGMGNPNLVYFPVNGMNMAVRRDGDAIAEAGLLRSPSFHWVTADYLPGPAVADMELGGIRAYLNADRCSGDLRKCVPVGGAVPKKYRFHNDAK